MKFMNPKAIAVRAAVTFCQVAISVFVGSGLFDFSIPTIRTAAVSGIGAALSVIYNALTQWLAHQDDAA